MVSAWQEVQDLLDQIRAVVHNPAVEKATDQISVLCSNYMAPDPVSYFPQGVNSKHFTPSEEAMLCLLHRRKGKVHSKFALLQVTPRADHADLPDEKGVDVRICAIRRKLRGTPLQGKIETIWGRGYRLNA